MSLALDFSRVRRPHDRIESVFGICHHRQNSLIDSVDTEGVHLENVRPSGGVPEWPKGSDCKSDAKASQVRILPPPPLIARGHRIVAITSAFQADDAGSIPAARSNL